MTRITPMFSILLLAACGTTVDNDDVLVSDDEAFGQLGGQVVDSEGAPVSGVTVWAQGLSDISGADGSYMIDGLSPDAEFTVEFVKSGYAKGYTRASLLSWEATTANKVMLEIDGYDTFDASEGGMVEVEVWGGRTLTVDFDPNTIVDANGNPYDGVVRVEVTYVNPYDEKLAAGAPGDLQALAYADDSTAKEAREPVQLVSYGMADITLFPEEDTTVDPDAEDTEGAEEEETLNLEEGASAGVKMPIYNPEASTYHVANGDGLPSWSFDADANRWIEEGEGDVGEDDEGLNFEYEASHFSWWNCDQGFVPTFACGRVVDYLGFPVRSSEVTARGQQTNSIAYTDADGFYMISVMAGDTVNFSASTYVAGTSNWPSDRHSMFIDGGESQTSCDGDEVPDIEIEVCRESGVVMTDNITSHLSATDANNGDRLRAFFWEAPGEIKYCINPWDDVPMESCDVVSTDDYATPHDMDSVDGLPMDLRPVGDWIELSTGRDTYVLNKESSDGKPFYTFQTENYNEGSVDYLETNDIDLRGGDVISAVAPGDTSVGMGSISESSWVSLPAEFTSNGISGPQSIASSSSLTLNFTPANNGDGILVLGGSVEVNEDGLADNNSDLLLCRFDDDGSIQIPSNELNEIDRGATAISIFRPEISWTPGPDGLPIRVQAFSGTSVQIELQ